MPIDVLTGLMEGEGQPAQQQAQMPMTQPQIAPQQSLADQLANSAGVQGVLGAGDAVRNTMSGAMNLIPGVNIPDAQTGSGTAYNIGKFLGNTGAFIGGGEALDTARAAAEGIPMLGQAASALGGSGLGAGLIRRGLGSAAYGYSQNPNDPTTGAAESAGLSAAFDSVPYIGQALNYARPQKLASSIMDTLGQGRSIQENQQSLASDIQGAYQNQRNIASSFYNPVMDKFGDTNIYQGTPMITNKGDFTDAAQYPQIDDSIFNTDRDLAKQHAQFMQNPTLENAHTLQSDLGLAQRNIADSTNPSLADLNTMKGYRDARQSILSDMNTSLMAKDPAMAQSYANGALHYYNNVVPYLQKPGIAAIAQGDVSNPGNISNLFSNPEPATLQVANDIGEQGQNKILYNELARSNPKQSPEKMSLMAATTPTQQSTFDARGLTNYVSPSLQQQFSQLPSMITNRNLLQRGGGALAGILAGSHLGESIPLAIETGGVLGGAAAPMISRMASAMVPNGLSNALRPAMGAIYPYARQSVIANTMGNQ